MLVRGLDGRLGLGVLAADCLADTRAKNTQLPIIDLLRQSVYNRLAGYENMNDAERLAQDPAFRLIGSEKIWKRGAALPSRLQSFETQILAEDGNFAGLARLNRGLVAKAEAFDARVRVVLDMDSTEMPVYGGQEDSAYNGHFESSCYHPLLLFNRDGDCVSSKLRPGSVLLTVPLAALLSSALPGSGPQAPQLSPHHESEHIAQRPTRGFIGFDQVSPDCVSLTGFQQAASCGGQTPIAGVALLCPWAKSTRRAAKFGTAARPRENMQARPQRGSRRVGAKGPQPDASISG
ncbi:MAG: transposase, partial [Terriglobales bacterium]